MTTSTNSVSSKFLTALKNKDHNKILDLVSNRQLSMKKKFHYQRKDRLHDLGDKMTAFLLTIKYCYREDVTEKMIASGADVNAVGYEYSNPTRKRMVTPLYYAVSKSCNKELLRRLISAGADVNKFSGQMFENEEEGGSMNFNSKSCSLDFALHSQFYDPEVIDILLENGADYNIRNDSSMLPLQIAMLYNYSDAVLSLVRYGGCAKPISYSDYSPLRLMLDFDELTPDDERGSPEQSQKTQSSLLRCVNILLNGGYEVFNDSEMMDMCQSEKSERETDRTVKDVCKIINDWLHQPKDLKVLCRLSIRHILQNNHTCNPISIYKIPIPKLLANYLNLCDLE